MRLWMLGMVLGAALCAVRPAAAASSPGQGRAADGADQAIARDALNVLGNIQNRLTTEGIDMDTNLLRRGLRELRLAFLGPLPEGGFQYATKNGTVSASYDTAWITTISPSAGVYEEVVDITLRHYSELRFLVPVKRNLYRENGEVLLKWIQVSTPRTKERPRVDLFRWFSPGDTYPLLLPQEEDVVRVRMAVATSREMTGKTVVAIEGRPFGYNFSSENPFIDKVHRVAAMEAKVQGQLRRTTVSELLVDLDAIQRELNGTVSGRGPGDDWRTPEDSDWPPADLESPVSPPMRGAPSSPVLLNRLRYIQSLLNGTPEEQLRGREELARFIRELESGADPEAPANPSDG